MTIGKGYLWIISTLFTSGILAQMTDLRTCVDLEEGICELEGLYSFCYTNLKTGEYNCDDEAKCAQKSETLRGKTAGGCFGTGVCCCKTEDVPELKSGAYKSGCHSLLRFFIMDSGSDAIHPQVKAMTEKTCAQIIREKAEKDGVEEDQVTHACHEHETTDEKGNVVTGKFCCCSSGDMCNEELWPMKKGADDLDFIPGVGTGGVSRKVAGFGVLVALLVGILLPFRV